MNTFFRASIFAAAASAVFVSASVSAVSSPGVYRWRASVTATGAPDTNWFNPSNWSTGQVPGPEDDVELDGDDVVVIDANARGATPAFGKLLGQARDLNIAGSARLEVVNGAVLSTRSEVVADAGSLVFRGSASMGDTLILGGTSESAASAPNISEVVVTKLTMDPSTQSKRIIVLRSSFNATTEVNLGLGGTTPASSPDVDGDGRDDIIVGASHYATLVADTLVLGGELRVSTYDGFSPRPGDTFQIMTANHTRSGEFDGLPEGGYVGCTEGSVGLRVSYRGGDGNDVVISAEQTDPGTCLLLPAVQKVREAASRASGSVPVLYDLLLNTPTTTTGLLLPAVQKVREAAKRR